MRQLRRVRAVLMLVGCMQAPTAELANVVLAAAVEQQIWWQILRGIWPLRCQLIQRPLGRCVLLHELHHAGTRIEQHLSNLQILLA